MDYDYRTRVGQSYDPQGPNYSRPASAASSSMYGQSPSLYPKIGSGGGVGGGTSIPAGRNPPFHHTPSPPSSGIGIRVRIKPEYQITPPPMLSPQTGEIPRSNFHYDFEFERNVLSEVVKENPNWSRLGLENVLPKPVQSPPSAYGASADPVVSKYIVAGLNREAVPLAVANFGDNPRKVKEFANGFTLLREMGFSPNSVAEALLMYDNDTDKALAHFLNNGS